MSDFVYCVSAVIETLLFRVSSTASDLFRRTVMMMMMMKACFVTNEDLIIMNKLKTISVYRSVLYVDLEQ